MWVLVWVCYDYERERVNERVHVCVHVCPLFPSSLWWWVRQRLGAIGGIWQGHGMFQKYLELRTQVNDTHVLPSPRVITQFKKTKDREQGSEMSIWAMWDHWQILGPLAKTDIAELGWSSGPCSCWRDLNIHEQGDHNSRLVLAVALITIHIRPVSSWIFSGSCHYMIISKTHLILSTAFFTFKVRSPFRWSWSFSDLMHILYGTVSMDIRKCGKTPDTCWTSWN